VVEVVEFETSDPQLRGEMTMISALADASGDDGGGGGTDVVVMLEGLPPGVPAATTRPVRAWRSTSLPH
jgi:hypothetical protein